MRRAVILFPSGLTLGNLFFGVFAIVAASRLEFVAAGVYVLLGGICDALDGRVARATNAGTEFGEELDSLVDAITFGLAPGMIMYFAVLNRSGWDWVFVFVFAACAVLRLARFNIEQAGSAKTYFQGLPSPAAGITLASYYWFSQSSLYSYGAIADLKWHVLLRYLMAFLSFLMISNVPYPVFPRTGFRSLRAIGATLLLIGSVALLASRRLEFFFPFALVYVAWGLLRWVFSGLFERRQPTLPYDLSEGEDDEDEDDDDDEEFELTDSRVHATRRSHRERAARTEHVAPVVRSSRPDREERADRNRSRTERTSPREQASERSSERPAERPIDRASEKGARPRDGERAKREGKQKERPRRERPAREARPEAPLSSTAGEAALTGVDAITLGDTLDTIPAGPTTVVATIEPAPTGTPTAETSDVTPAPRKRKRRRRRGERKDRQNIGEGGQAAGGSESDEGDSSDHDDDGGEESPYERPDSSSPGTALTTTPFSSSEPASPAPPAAESPRSAVDPTPLLPRSSSDSPE
jgi:CDP-diacylglycerol--serine O-phosphatidyltransferase